MGRPDRVRGQGPALRRSPVAMRTYRISRDGIRNIGVGISCSGIWLVSVEPQQFRFFVGNVVERARQKRTLRITSPLLRKQSYLVAERGAQSSLRALAA